MTGKITISDSLIGCKHLSTEALASDLLSKDMALEDVFEAYAAHADTLFGEKEIGIAQEEVQRNVCGDVIDPQTGLPKINTDQIFKF